MIEINYKISEKDLKRIMEKVPIIFYTTQEYPNSFDDFKAEFNIEEIKD